MQLEHDAPHGFSSRIAALSECTKATTSKPKHKLIRAPVTYQLREGIASVSRREVHSRHDHDLRQLVSLDAGLPPAPSHSNSNACRSRSSCGAVKAAVGSMQLCDDG